ncbi:MAG: tripartite tricarboxylate transporter substrate binding protein [Comamonas sp.]
MFRKLLLAALLGLPVLACAYPDRPVRLVVPFMAGSPADALARIVADGVSKDLGQTMVVDNRPGASGMIGMASVAKATPDGYTLALGSMDTQSINPWIYKKLPYRAQQDFAPVAMLGSFSMLLVGGGQLAGKSGREVIEAARAQPEKISYGTWGVGSLAHLWGLRLEQAAGVKLFHVPFQGTPAAMQGLLAGNIDLIFLLPQVADGLVQKGSATIIGTTGAQRAPGRADIPTLAEQGFQGFSGVEWFAVYAPARTPAGVVQTLNQSINRVLRNDDVARRITALSMTAEGGTPEALRATEIRDSDDWRALIERSHFEQLD